MLRTASGLIATGLASMAPARVLRPATAAEALAALAEPGAVAIAGGTDLVAQANEGLSPRLLVSLDRLPGLDGIAIAEGAVTIGALVTHRAGSTHPGLRAAIPGFGEAWAMIANPRIRARATLGGNLMARRTRYEMSLLLTALQARLLFAGGAEATPEDLWEGRVPSPSLLLGVRIARRPGLRMCYQRALRPLLTLAVVRDDAAATAAIATEMLRPHRLDVADATLAALPAGFADAAVTHWYARRAGAALLARGLEALDAR